jgi:hypothetical protein
MAKNTEIGHVDATVKIGDNLVSIRRTGVSASTVAKLLGRETSADGKVETLTLDRIVHRVNEDTIGGDKNDRWSLTGAFVSVLYRTLQSSAGN